MLSGEATLFRLFCLSSKKGSTLKRKNLLPLECHIFRQSIIFLAGLHSAVGRLSDCRSRGCRLLSHIIFVEIEYEIIFVRSFSTFRCFKKGSYQLLVKVFAHILVNGLED